MSVVDVALPWQVIHGDCLAVLPTLPAGSIDAMLCDPPYGIGGTVVRGGCESTQALPEWDVADHSWIEPAAAALRDGGHLVSFCDHKETGAIWNACEAAGLRPRTFLLWLKNNPPPNPRRCFQSAWEIALWATKGSGYEWSGGGATPNVYYGNIVTSDRRHETQKDVGLMRWLVRLLLPDGGLVCDAFAGSGTTGVAALEEGCRFIGIEKDEANAVTARARVGATAGQALLPFGAA